MALCPFAKQLLIPPDARDPRQPMRAVVLHVDAGNAESLYTLFRDDQNTTGLESHFFVKTDGSIEQYRDTAFQADAAYLSNDFAIQVETQGFGTGTWTPAQFASIQKLILWCHQEHPAIPLAKILSDTGSGIGYHCQFNSWNLNFHSCPGPDRVTQFNNVLVPWLSTAGRPVVTVNHVKGARALFHKAKRLLKLGVGEAGKADPSRTVAHAQAGKVAALVAQLRAILKVFPKK